MVSLIKVAKYLTDFIVEDDSDADSDKDLYRMHDVLIQPYEYGDEEEQQSTTEEASSNDGETSDEPQVFFMT